MPTRTASFAPLLVLSLLATWLVWGSSFVAISFSLEGMPPLLLMASRFVAAGLIATVAGLLLARRAGKPLPSARAWRHAAVIGVGYITVGMGATGWAATRLPTGVAALLVASAPLFIALLQPLFARGTRTGSLGLVGIGIGLAGVAVLVAPGGGGSIDAAAAAVLIASNATWAAASLFAQRAEQAGSLVLGTGMQMLTGAVVLLAIALATGEAGRVDLASIDALVLGSWAYLVLPAAIGGFLAYGWLLDNVSASLASTYAFINPLVAVALGAAVLGETVDARVAIAAATVVAAVVLLMLGERRMAASTTVDAIAKAPPQVRRDADATRSVAARPIAVRIGRARAGGWSPAPTPAFARRASRPWQATDGMDALAIDEAFELPRR